MVQKAKVVLYKRATSALATPHSSRPVTRKGATPGNGMAAQRGNGRARAMPAPPPTYGNGSRVDANNLTETFAQYVAEKKATPESKSVLLAFYQQRVANRSLRANPRAQQMQRA